MSIHEQQAIDALNKMSEEQQRQGYLTTQDTQVLTGIAQVHAILDLASAIRSLKP